MKGEEAGGMTLQFLKSGRKGQCLEVNLLVRVPNLSLTGVMRCIEKRQCDGLVVSRRSFSFLF